MVWAEPLSTSLRSAGVRFLTGLPFSSTTVTGRVMAPTAEATPGPEAGFWSADWALGGVVWAGAAVWAVAGNKPVESRAASVAAGSAKRRNDGIFMDFARIAVARLRITSLR